jgi:hypothetical protein
MNNVVIFLVQIATLLVLSGVVLYLRQYITKKAENLATKEDAAEITNEIEKIKHEYSSKLFIGQVRYQNEFTILVHLSEKLAVLHDVLSNFETSVLFRGKYNPDSSIKEEMKEVLQAMKDLYWEYEKHSPFYPQEIYDGVSKLHRLVWSQLVVEGDAQIQKCPGYDVAYEIAKKNAPEKKEISAVIEEIRNAIRKRVEYWEKIDTDRTNK